MCFKMSPRTSSRARFHCVIGDRLVHAGTECITVAFFHTDEVRTDNTVLITVEKYKRSTRPRRRFKVGVIFQPLEFWRHEVIVRED